MLQATIAGCAMRIGRTFSFFPCGTLTASCKPLPVLSHPTLSRSRLYQGMSEHYEATTGAIGTNALLLVAACRYNEFSV